MSRETKSERLFEEFCRLNGVEYERVPEGSDRQPDFRLPIQGSSVFVEIEQIESTQGLNPMGVSTRIVGDHVRRKISEARAQMQTASRTGSPTILVIYNEADEPFQSFGTEPHDFICAMYGELTVRLVDGKAGGSYHGRNARLRDDVNTSFSAVGHLRSTQSGPKLTIYENVYARHPLPYAALPACVEVVRVEIRDAT